MGTKTTVEPYCTENEKILKLKKDYVSKYVYMRTNIQEVIIIM